MVGKYGGEVWWESIVGNFCWEVCGEIWRGSMVGKCGGEVLWASMVGKYVEKIWWHKKMHFFIGATLRIGQDIQCLPYARFFPKYLESCICLCSFFLWITLLINGGSTPAY